MTDKQRRLLLALTGHPKGLPVASKYLDDFAEMERAGWVKLSSCRTGLLRDPDNFWVHITDAGILDSHKEPEVAP